MRISSVAHRKRARIEIIPLIDIVFFLLATFVMVSLSMVKNMGVAVHLPTAATSEPQPRETALTVSIDKDGNYFLDKVQLQFEALLGELQRRKSASEELRIFVNADKDVRFQAVVNVLDETRRMGITRVAIETAKPGPNNQ